MVAFKTSKTISRNVRIIFFHSTSMVVASNKNKRKWFRFDL